MIYKVVMSARANRRLYRIYDYIAGEASSETAERFVAAIQAYCFGLANFPKRGAPRDDISPGLRIVGFRRRVAIAFFVEHDEVIVSDIFYGGEDYESALAPKP